MVIDANMYWFPEDIFTDEHYRESFLRSLPSAYGVCGRSEQIDDNGRIQMVVEAPKGYDSLNFVQGEYRMERQIHDMDQAGVDMAILKLPGCQGWMNLELCSRFNTEMAEHVKKGNGRFEALALVPPLAGKEGIYELERCVKELGMKGVQVSSHYGNLYLDNEAFYPFFEKVNELKLPVYVHHSPVPVEYGSIYEYNNLRRSYGRCMDQTIAIGREVYSGLFDRFPDLKLVHSMLGGAFFSYLSSMFRKKPSGNQDTVNRFDTDTDRFCDQIRENIYYELSHAQPWGKELLECAVSILGADHIIFGTSYPVRSEWLTGGPDFVRKLEITDEEKTQILGGNAEHIYMGRK